MSAAEVRARIARCMLAAGDGGDGAPDPAARVGGFTLRPDQSRTLARIRAALREFGGALVADRPGTGKTVLALAIAAEHSGPALIVAPAALREQWSRAAARAEVPMIFVSVESLSRGALPPRGGLVIVDEAHHVRTPGTRRYARLAATCLDARVILLTATPVVNRRADRDALLALFLGRRSERMAPEEESRCIIRGYAATDRPAVMRIGAIGSPLDIPGLADAIATLPPPFPLAAGADARALVVMTLAMAWRSSVAALDVALRRRLQRGEVIADILRAGGLPSRELLRHWVLADESTQLALHELLATPCCAPAGSEIIATSGSTAANGTLAGLERHLTAVRAIRDRIRPHRSADAAARAAAILALADAHPDRRLVVFARHAETVRALHAELRHHAGVVAIIGGRVVAAAGRWSRDEILRAIGPRARPLRANDPRAIRFLLATDVVAEGVEMQGVGIVVHADLPWTPARLEQRLGRVTRVGSSTREVFEVWLRAPRAARAIIRLGARLRRKRDARSEALAEAAATARIAALLSRWCDGVPHGSAARHACVAAACDGFVTVLREGTLLCWLVGERRDGRWRVSSAPRRVLRLLRAAADAHDDVLFPRDRLAIERIIRRTVAGRAARALTSAARITERSAPRTETDRRARQVRARLAPLLAHAPALARPAIARSHSEWLRALDGPLEAERERRLDALLRTERDDARFARRLGALLTRRITPERHEPHRGPVRLVALLVLAPTTRATAAPVPSPPSASPGSAAPR